METGRNNQEIDFCQGCLSSVSERSLHPIQTYKPTLEKFGIKVKPLNYYFLY